MQKEGLLLMRQCEVDRLKVINEVLKGQLKQRQAVNDKKKEKKRDKKESKKG